MRKHSFLKYNKLGRVLIGGAFLASLTGCVVAPGYYGTTGTAYSSYYVGSPYYYPYPGYYAPGYRTAIVVGGGYPGWRGNGGYPGGWHGGPGGQWHGGPGGWHGGGPGNPGSWHGGPPGNGGHGGPAGPVGGGMGGGHGSGQH